MRGAWARRAGGVAATLLAVSGHAPLDIDPCTVIAVEMVDDINSAEARPGDFFRFQTVNAATSASAPKAESSSAGRYAAAPALAIATL